MTLWDDLANSRGYLTGYMDLEYVENYKSRPPSFAVHVSAGNLWPEVFHFWTGVLNVTSALIFYIVFDVGADTSSF